MNRFFTPITICALLVFGIFAGPAAASTVSWESLAFTFPGTAVSGLDDAILSNITYQNYTISAEFCEDSACTGVSPTNLPYDSYLRFTNVTITCNAGAGASCGGFSITFEADTLLTSQTATANVSFGLDGYTNTGAVSGGAGYCIGALGQTCSSGLSGSQDWATEFDATTSGFSYSAPSPGTATFTPGINVYGEIDIYGMQGNQTLTLPGSLDLFTTFTTPEPGTLGELGLGVACLLGWAARRRRQ